jgi:hypothetical protein
LQERPEFCTIVITLNSDPIEKYMSSFFGYGSWNQPTWFIGMEEGGCASLDEFNRRVDAWVQRGCKELEDARSYHEAIGVDQWFRKGAHLQSTWEKLIRIYLALHEQPTDKESVRRFQIGEFGNQERGFPVVELFPLPSATAQSWIYSSIELPYLTSREVYQSAVEPKRTQTLRERIHRYRPKHVVCYGLSYRSWWGQLAGQCFGKSALNDVYEARTDNTLFLAVPHPVAHGKTQNYWSEIGKYLKGR